MDKPISDSGISKPKQEMENRSHIANQKPLVDGEANDRLPSGYDQFTVTDEMKKDLGIDPGWGLQWIRDDRWWQRHVPGNRFYEFKHNNPGAELVLHEGQPFSNGTDLVLAKIPPEIAERNRKGREQTEREFFKQQEMDKHEEDWDPEDKKKVRAQMKANSAMHERNGMIGPRSRTEGIPYEEAFRLEQKRGVDTDADELRWARGNRHVDYDDDAAAELMERETHSRGGKTISIPPNVRPRNLAKV